MIASFWQIDAFADCAFTGNPAAVLILDAWPDDATLVQIAAENAVSQTAFVIPPRGGEMDHALRWFSAAGEVAMCGHATLAAGHVVLAQNGARDAVRFATRRAGSLTVRRAGTRYALDLPALAPAPRLLPALTAALDVAACETLWHAQGYAVAVLADEAAVRACVPDFAALAGLGDWLVIITAPGAASDIVSRAFAPGNGFVEDPVTGSAHAVVVPYWAERLGRTGLSAVQASTRGGRIDCTLAAGRVILEGGCVTVIEGRFHV